MVVFSVLRKRKISFIDSDKVTLLLKKSVRHGMYVLLILFLKEAIDISEQSLVKCNQPARCKKFSILASSTKCQKFW